MAEDHEVVLEVRGVPGHPCRVALLLRDQSGHRAEREFDVDLRRKLPGREGDWEAFLDRYIRSQNSSAERRAFGDALLRALTEHDEFAYVWYSILGASARRPYRLVVLLHPGSEAFARLPLELLRDARGDLFALPGSALIRTVPDATPREAVIAAAPRVLLAWAMPKDQHVVDVTPHETALREIHGTRLTVLPHANRARLGETLASAKREGRPFEIVQIVAHGSGAFGEASLAFENEKRLTESVSARLLAKTLRAQGLELVALCSCQSGIGFAGVGQTLLAETGADIPCVVACQADLPVAGSAALLARFHRLLLETRDPAVALGRARREAYDQSDAWSVPVLLARPSLREAKPVPLFGIPPRVTTWQARDELVAELGGALRQRRIVTAIGIPGVGKTELCFEVARQLLAQGKIARAICMHVQSGMEVGQLRTMLAAALGQPAMSSPAQLVALLDGVRETLIVIDNLEDLMGSSDSARELVELLDTVAQRTRNVRFLSSSRWPIGAPAETVVAVGPLPRDAGAALLALELAEAGLDPQSWLQNRASWHELVDALRGQARAIRLLAARWAELRIDAAAALAELRSAIASARVDWSLVGSKVAFDRLDAAARDDLRVLAAAFALALQRLEVRAPDALEALRRLLLFPAGLPERTAMMVAGGLHGVGLQRLYERRLVDWRDGRVHVPLLLREGGFVDSANGSDRHEAFGTAILELAVHAATCHAQASSGDILAAVSRFVAEEPVLVALAEFAHSNPKDPAVRSFPQLVAPARQLLDLADRRQHLRPIAEAGLAVARAHHDREGEANCLQASGDLRLRLADLDGARKDYDDALRIFRDIEERLGEANCLQASGDLRRRLADLDGARKDYDDALRIFRDIEARLGEANCLQASGDLRRRLADLDGARKDYDDALRIFRDIEARLGEANCLQASGDLRRRLDDLDGARKDYDDALRIFRDIEARLGEANCLQASGDLRRRLDDLDGARKDYDNALRIFRDIEERLGEANCLQASGDLRRRLDDLDGARKDYDDALRIFRDIEARLGEANCLQASGDLRRRLDDLDGARKDYDNALRIFRDIEARLGEANCLQASGDLRRRLDDLDGARKDYDNALRIFRDIEERLGEANCLQASGDLRRRLDDLDGARKDYDDALRIFRDIEERLGEANCLKASGDLRRRLADLDGARKDYDDALRIFRDIEARLGEANCLKASGDLRRRLADLDGARKDYDDALRIFRDIEERLGEANCLQASGDLRRRLDDLDGARKDYDDALRIFRDIEERLGEANCLKASGDLRLRLADLDGARKDYDDALRIFRDIEERLGEANCLQASGDLRLRLADLDGARKDYDDALRIFRDIEERLGEANCLQASGDLRRRLADLDGARKDYDDALRIFRDIEARLGEANCLQMLGLLAMQGGDARGAFASLLQVVRLHEAIGDRLGLQADWGYLARAAAAAGIPDHALVLAERSLRIGRAIGDRFGETISLELQVTMLIQRQDFLPAIAAMLLHRRLAQQMGDARGAAAFAAQLAAIEEQMAQAQWRELAAEAEPIRAAAIAAAEHRIRAAGGDPERLPDP